MIRSLPGNFYLGERKLAPAIEKEMRESMGWTTWYVQYWKGNLTANLCQPGRCGTVKSPPD